MIETHNKSQNLSGFWTLGIGIVSIVLVVVVEKVWKIKGIEEEIYTC